MISRRDLLGSAMASACVLAGAPGFRAAAAPAIGPKPNPFLSAPVYSIAHFDPAQSDTFPYAVARGDFRVDLAKQPRISGGPINIMTYSAAIPGFMWAISTNRIRYVDARDGNWKLLAETKLPGSREVSAEHLKAVMDRVYKSVDELEAELIRIVGPSPTDVTGAGLYSLVDSDNVVYASAGAQLTAFALRDAGDPSKGIEVKRSFDITGVLRPLELPGQAPVNKIVGLGMTYDGQLAIGSTSGVLVIDREFKKKPSVYSIDATQFVSNSFCIDEANGIYLASGSFQPRGDGILRKLVWTGAKISDDESDGAWSAPYDGGDWPPAIKAGTGTGSTPTLMGFGADENRFVVLTDGANRMRIVSFWRDAIPADFVQKPGTRSRRIADQMPITAGLPPSTAWVQSEQSVVVNGFGAFVVNNVVSTGHPDKLVDVLAMGPLLQPPQGVERVEWDVAGRKWKAVWTRKDVSSISMVPAASATSGIVFVNGYDAQDGWSVSGLDWATGATVTRIIFGPGNNGNGAYAILQFFADGDLLFNSVGGPYRIRLKKA